MVKSAITKSLFSKIENFVIADSKASSQLDNPFLGSIGIAILEVSPPPVIAQHDYSFRGYDSDILRNEITYGTTRGMGGLAWPT